MGKIVAFDHVVFWVANAKTAASYYIARFGFQPLGIKDGDKNNTISYAVKQNKIIFVFESPKTNDHQINEELLKHGDFVKDVAFTVSNIEDVLQHAKENGAEVIEELQSIEDGSGVIRVAVLKSYGDNTHTLVDRSQYKGVFMPGYETLDQDPINDLLPETNLLYIDHVESDLMDGCNDSVSEWYQKVLKMHKFWCVDYNTDWKPWSNISHTSVANDNENVVISMKESAHLTKSNHAKDFVNTHGDSGVEHVALYTDDIVSTIRSMQSRGADLIKWPPTYYKIIREKLKDSPVKIDETIDSLQDLNILIDYDEEGYMLQTFTKHTQPRATLFMEIIQRRGGHKGFGAGNYKMLAEAIEMLEK